MIKTILIIAALFSIGKLSDTTYIRSLNSNETQSVKVAIPEGHTTIEVFNPYEETKLNCSFTDVSTKFTGLEEKNTNVCRGTVNTKFPLVIEVKTTNLSNKAIEYRVVRTTL